MASFTFWRPPTARSVRTSHRSQQAESTAPNDKRDFKLRKMRRPISGPRIIETSQPSGQHAFSHCWHVASRGPTRRCADAGTELRGMPSSAWACEVCSVLLSRRTCPRRRTSEGMPRLRRNNHHWDLPALATRFRSSRATESRPRTETKIAAVEDSSHTSVLSVNSVANPPTTRPKIPLAIGHHICKTRCSASVRWLFDIQVRTPRRFMSPALRGVMALMSRILSRADAFAVCIAALAAGRCTEFLDFWIKCWDPPSKRQNSKNPNRGAADEGPLHMD